MKRESAIFLALDASLFGIALILEHFMGWNKVTRWFRREPVGLEHRIHVYPGDVDTKLFHGKVKMTNKQRREKIEALWARGY